MTTRTCTLMLTLGLFLSAVISTAAAGDMVPFKGRYENNQGHVTGNVTHLGAWAQVNPPFTWQAANGDSITILFSNFLITKEIAPSVFEYTIDITIIGGTGRFQNATGSAIGYGTWDVIEAHRWGTIDGMISRPNSGD